MRFGDACILSKQTSLMLKKGPSTTHRILLVGRAPLAKGLYYCIVGLPELRGIPPKARADRIEESSFNQNQSRSRGENP
jgi:hypothetical protein